LFSEHVQTISTLATQTAPYAKSAEDRDQDLQTFFPRAT